MTYITTLDIDGSQDIQHILSELTNLVVSASLKGSRITLKGQLVLQGIDLTNMPSLVWLAKLVQDGFLINDKLHLNLSPYTGHGRETETLYTVREKIENGSIVKLEKGIYTDDEYLPLMSVGNSDTVLNYTQSQRHSSWVHEQLRQMNDRSVVYQNPQCKNELYIFDMSENFMEFLIHSRKGFSWTVDFDGDVLIGGLTPHSLDLDIVHLYRGVVGI